MTNIGNDNGPSASNLDMVNNNYHYENNSVNALVNNGEQTGTEEPKKLNIIFIPKEKKELIIFCMNMNIKTLAT